MTAGWRRDQRRTARLAGAGGCWSMWARVRRSCLEWWGSFRSSSPTMGPTLFEGGPDQGPLAAVGSRLGVLARVLVRVSRDVLEDLVRSLDEVVARVSITRRGRAKVIGYEVAGVSARRSWASDLGDRMFSITRLQWGQPLRLSSYLEGWRKR